jgi:hypothetical protein
LGLVAVLKLFKWHETQAVDNPTNTLFTWQAGQATLTWNPVKGNGVFE